MHFPGEKYVSPDQNKFRDKKGKIMICKRREDQEAPEVPKEAKSQPIL